MLRTPSASEGHRLYGQHITTLDLSDDGDGGPLTLSKPIFGKIVKGHSGSLKLWPKLTLPPIDIVVHPVAGSSKFRLPWGFWLYDFDVKNLLV